MKGDSTQHGEDRETWGKQASLVNLISHGISISWKYLPLDFFSSGDNKLTYLLKLALSTCSQKRSSC